MEGVETGGAGTGGFESSAVNETLLDTESEGPGGSELALERGALIGRYVLLEKIGSGGMGVVFAAYDPELDRKVALKVLHQQEGKRRGKGQARLMREAQSMAKLSHPNVIAIHDVGFLNGTVFIAMEYVAGTTLSQWQSESRAWNELLDVYTRAGRGLAAAHSAGLIHRDFKPDNVLVGDDGRVRVLDFGLARHSELESGVAPVADLPDGTEPQLPSREDLEAARDGTLDETVVDSEVGRDLTRTGAVMGTPAYMSPEQHLGEAADARSDQFSFCVAFYEGLYGSRPFAGDNRATLAFQVTQGNVSSAPRDSEVPNWLRRVLLRGLSVEPERRHPTMAELLEELARDRGAGRRRLMGALGGALLIAGGAFGYSHLGQDEELCGGAEQRLTGAWDEQRSERVQAAFETTGLPFAADSWTGARDILDSYADAWASGYRDACEATHVRGEQSAELLDRRMSCLDDRRRELAALVDRFEHADAQTVERAIDAASDLTGPSACADQRFLRARVPPPVDPETRRVVEDLEARLAEINALRVSGSVEQGLEQAQALVDEARETSYRPIEARALLALGGQQLEAYATRDAIETFEEAIVAAEAGADVESAARAYNALIDAYGDRELELDEAESAGRHARALLEQLGHVRELEADYLENAAALDGRRMRYSQALDGYRRALDIVEEIRGPRTQAASGVHVGMGNVYYDLAQYDEALAAYRLSLEIGEEVYGPEHPQLADELSNIGIVLDDLGRYGEAREYYRRALDIIVAAYGPDNPDAAAYYNNLGSSFYGEENWSRARKAFSQALSAWEASHGPDHPDVAMALTNLALIDEEEGKLDDALAKTERSLEIYEARFGQRHRSYAWALHLRAGVLSAKGELDRAIEDHRRALAIQKEVLGPEHLYVADGLQYYGDALGEAGRWEEALAQYQRGVALREPQLPDDHRELAVARGSLGGALVELDRHQGAVPLLERAIEVLEAKESDAYALADFRVWLGRAIWETGGDRGRARDLVRLGRERLAQDEEQTTAQVETIETIDKWLQKHR